MGKHKRTAYQKACAKLEEEGRKQCFLLYGAAAIALYRHWGLRMVAIGRLFEITGEVWKTCACDNMKSMIEMCEEETGIEIQCGNGKSWRDLPYLNATLDASHMTNAQFVYMRQRQVHWIAPQVMACILVALHRKYGFGFDRCSRIYTQIKEIEEEYGHDPKRVKAACLELTGVNVEAVITTKREATA